MAEGTGSTDGGDVGRAPLVEVHPATADRFDAVAAVLRPRDDGARISATLAFVGTTSLFEATGFQRVVITSSTAGGRPRWLVRRSL